MADTPLVDPLGRTIVLHDHTWFGHIVKRHPDMRSLRTYVETAIIAPTRICFSTSDPDCRVYYGPGPTQGILVAVVGDVVGGYVRTAYRTTRIKGTPEW